MIGGANIMELFENVPGMKGYIIASSGFDSRPSAYEYRDTYIPTGETTVWFCQQDNLWYVILKNQPKKGQFQPKRASHCGTPFLFYLFIFYYYFIFLLFLIIYYFFIFLNLILLSFYLDFIFVYIFVFSILFFRFYINCYFFECSNFY